MRPPRGAGDVFQQLDKQLHHPCRIRPATSLPPTAPRSSCRPPAARQAAPTPCLLPPSTSLPAATPPCCSLRPAAVLAATPLLPTPKPPVPSCCHHRFQLQPSSSSSSSCTAYPYPQPQRLFLLLALAPAPPPSATPTPYISSCCKHPCQFQPTSRSSSSCNTPGFSQL